MRSFLEMLHRGAWPSDLTSRWRSKLGAETFDALVATGILQPSDPATWYPCPGGGDACPRLVVENPGDAEHPFVAVPEDGGCCAAVPLREEDLAQHAVSAPHFVRALRGLLRIDGPFALDDELFPCTVRIGRTTEDALPRDVLLATWPTYDGFESFLASRRSARRPSLVLVPRRMRGVPSSVEDHHGPGEHVEIVFLEDLLAILDGRIQRVPDWRHAPGVREPDQSSGSAFCVLVAHDGARPIDEAAYRDIVGRADEFDLFIDTLARVEAGRCRASRRLPDGTVEGATLTPLHASILVELIERRQALGAGELPGLASHRSSEKQVEAARRAVDVKLGRYQWRALQLIRGDVSRYLFAPPEGFRFAVIRPIADGK